MDNLTAKQRLEDKAQEVDQESAYRELFGWTPRVTTRRYCFEFWLWLSVMEHKGNIKSTPEKIEIDYANRYLYNFRD